MSSIETGVTRVAAGAALLQDFVGRVRPLEELRAAFAESAEGRGKLVFIRGEAGIGKSRLADEFARQAVSGGTQVLWGRCWEGGGAPAYWPWVQIVRAHARCIGADQVLAQLGDHALAFRSILPGTGERGPGMSRDSAAAGVHTRGAWFESVIFLLRTAAQSQVLVIVLDDLHVADADSILLLSQAARELRNDRVLLLGTYRDTEAHQREDVGPLFAQMEAECASVCLAGLSHAEVGELLRRIEVRRGTDHRSDVDATVIAIQALTAGNPFFVQEVLRILAAESAFGELELDERRLKLPAHVHEAIRRRLRSMPDEMRDVLRIGAAIGRDFELNVVQRVVDSTPQRLDVKPLLESACTAAVLRPAEGRDRYAFLHFLIAEALYDELADSQRAALHRRVGTALEEIYGSEAEQHIAELASHFVRGAVGGDADKAIDYAARAGDRAAAVCAYDEAVDQYQTALELFELRTDMPRTRQTRRCQLLLALERLQVRTGAREDALATATRAAAAARQIESAELLAQVAIGVPPRGNVAGRHGQPVVELLKDAASALVKANREQSGLYAAVLSSLAVAQNDATVEDRDDLATAAVTIARDAGDPALLAQSLLARREAIQDPIFEERQLADTTEAIELAQAIGDQRLEARGRIFRVVNLMRLGATHEAQQEIETNTQLAEKLSERELLQLTLIQQTMWALFVGQLARAEATVWRSLELAQHLQDEEIGSRVVASGSDDGSKQPTDFISQLYGVRHEQGRGAEFAGGLKALADELDTVPAFQAAYALVNAVTGAEDEARRAFEPLAAVGFQSIPRDGSWLAAICMLAETCARLDDRDRARSLYEWLRPYARRNMVAGLIGFNSMGSVSRYLGLLAATLGNWPESDEHFELALRENERMGTRPWTAYTQCDYARALLARNRVHASRARDLLHAAIATARDLDYLVLESTALRLLEGLP